MRRFIPVLLVASLAACSSSDGDGGSSASASCSKVKNPTLLETMGTTDAQAVRAGSDGHFVARAGGATWFTTSDIDKDDGGLVLPLNDAAREANPEMGADVEYGERIYKGHTDGDPGARVVRSCV